MMVYIVRCFGDSVKDERRMKKGGNSKWPSVNPPLYRELLSPYRKTAPTIH
jgi:hypothetical protein